MESDAVQIENKPLECRFILLGALSVLQPPVLYLARSDSSTEKPNTKIQGQEDVGTPITWRQALGTGGIVGCPQNVSKMPLFIKHNI